MALLDVFNQDPFTAIEMTAAVEKVPYLPQGIGSLGIFEPEPIRTKVLMVEQREGKLVLIPFTDRGAPGTQRTTEQRTARHFEVPRIRTEDTIRADELADIRQFGQESELTQVQKELARRMVGPTGLRSSLEYTLEYHRLAAVQGLLLDADDSVKFNWYSEFGITPPGEIVFNFPALEAGYSAASQTGNLRPILHSIVRYMQRAAKGAWIENVTRPVALCGDAFFDTLTSYGEIRSSYLNWFEAQKLRENPAFEVFPWGGIDWVNYRGSDDTLGLQGATTNGSGVVACASANASMIGDQVSGPNIPAASTIGAVNAGISFTLAGGVTASATGTGVFNLGAGNAYSGGGNIAIPSNKVKFFPRGAPGVFQVAYAPGESFDQINALGRREYVRLIRDRDYDEWVKVVMTSYPLHICTRPELLFSGTMDASDD